MRSLVITALIVTTALAGCLDVDLPTADHDVEAPTLPWKLTDCATVISAVPVAADALAPHLPDGFEPSPPSAIGLPPSPGKEAILGFAALSCDTFEGVNETVAETTYASIFAFVTPPESLAEDVTYHFVKWDTVMPESALKAAMADAGLPVKSGESTFFGIAPDLDPGQGRGPVQVTLAMEGETYGFNGAAGGEWDGPTTGALTDFIPAEDGNLARMRSDFEWETLHTGSGYVRVPDDAWTVDVMGGPRAHAYFLWGEMASMGGTVVLPGA